MEQDRNDQAVGAVNFKNALWGVFYCGSRSYIGKVTGVNMEKVAGSFPGKKNVLTADVVTLCPAFDYFAPLHPTRTRDGGMAFAREPVITSLDFVLDESTIHTRVDSALFFDELSENDRELYENMVVQAMQSNKENSERRRAQKSNIILPAAGGIVPPDNGRSRHG